MGDGPSNAGRLPRLGRWQTRRVSAREVPPMKSACLVAVVALALLVAAPARAAGGGLGAGDRATLTAPTNIASYLWATLGAREVGIIGAAEERSRIGRTLDTLARMDRDAPSGQFFNWYDPATGA